VLPPHLANPSAKAVKPAVAPDNVVVTAARAAIWAETGLSMMRELPGLKPYLRATEVWREGRTVMSRRGGTGKGSASASHGMALSHS